MWEDGSSRILRWISGYTLKDIIRYEDIRKGLGIIYIEDEMKENHSRWFGHIQQPKNIENLIL